MAVKRILDLFGGAGIGADGYKRAFPDAEIVSVDINPQPNNPHTFVQADAMDFPLEGFDFIHASPPCQGYTNCSNRWRGNGGAADSHPLLIAPIRERLKETGVPYVIENVVGARRHLVNPVIIHGGSLGLRTQRPRLYESNFPIERLPYKKIDKPIGVYGRSPDGRWMSRNPKTGVISDLRVASSVEEGMAAMGVDRDVSWRELAESIPPAHTEYIGSQLKKYLESTGRM